MWVSETFISSINQPSSITGSIPAAAISLRHQQHSIRSCIRGTGMSRSMTAGWPAAVQGSRQLALRPEYGSQVDGQLLLESQLFGCSHNGPSSEGSNSASVAFPAPMFT